MVMPTSSTLAFDMSASQKATAEPLSGAIGLSSSRALLSVQLNLSVANFTKWNIFMALLSGHGLLHHIDGSAAPTPDDAIWAFDDYVILSIMYGSIYANVLNIILDKQQIT
ncbi:hypothetical protein GUJ93_ZPchr0002g25269 [Zizania palustris]|uniref:Retrotransposon Copia-like N-terminal domain-containing protein n=1 Tax=Zizania palustris TaxID=103762 RepID=A0A8J5SSW9_ZIZPA|nr:hypothetical protein GUJ93_ZPchr0002g25269 [Zizania palustris]